MSLKHIESIIPILKRYYRTFNNPSVTKISKKFHQPFVVLISCILSQRTKDKTTDEAAERLFKLAQTPQEMIKISTTKLQNIIYPVGFYRTKARNIKKVSQDILKRFKGRVPDNLQDLLSLRGVGRKTANLVLTLGFHKLGICVDTHVHRISNRLGIVKTKTPFDTEMNLRRTLPKKFWIIYNDLLVSFGQNICKPISPLCSSCRISRYCPQIGVLRHR